MSCESESSITYAEGGVGLSDGANDVYVLEQGHPNRAWSWAAGQTSRSIPAMVIRGSLGGSTITIVLMSGMEMHVSSPKPLQVAKQREGKQETYWKTRTDA